MLSGLTALSARLMPQLPTLKETYSYIKETTEKVAIFALKASAFAAVILWGPVTPNFIGCALLVGVFAPDYTDAAVNKIKTMFKGIDFKSFAIASVITTFFWPPLSVAASVIYPAYIGRDAYQYLEANASKRQTLPQKVDLKL